MTLLQISDPSEKCEQIENLHKLICGSAKDVAVREKYVMAIILRK